MSILSAEKENRKFRIDLAISKKKEKSQKCQALTGDYFHYYI